MGKATTQDLKVNARGEVLKIRSPAEFFAENQNIAGFDNPGKSMFTTIRELVENSLDAAESIHVLPSIQLRVTEMDEVAFNKLRGVKKIERVDHDLYRASKPGSSKRRKSNAGTPVDLTMDASCASKSEDLKDLSVQGTPAPSPTSATKTKKRQQQRLYYKIVCKDNGVGMMHKNIPDMLGRVLSGSKYGVRQTRGKFGLGAKMALIWAKKSTGMPIEVLTAHHKDRNGCPGMVSYCKLDIDIYKNEPHVLVHEKRSNVDGWRGTEMTVVIGGNWTTYKARIIQYLQQLAIITPYSEIELTYECSFNEKRNFQLLYERRSEQMPPLAREVRHHPSALNDLLLRQLMDHSKHKTLANFLISDLANINAQLALRLIIELGKPFEKSMPTSELSSKQIHQLVQLMKQVGFKPPEGEALSPAGEYNLRLGILKELDPDMVATHTEPPNVFEGHAFIIEAGLSLGGKGVKEGLNIFRFANRIPLLFEAGGDVVTRTAQKSIKWGNYKIDHKRDKIGLFVSIVSTKIPFKGTGKEYIGDDIAEIKAAVKRVIQHCCLQLKSKLLKQGKANEIAQRKKNLVKYVPDAARAIFGVLTQMNDLHEEKRKVQRSPKTTTSGCLSTNAWSGLASSDPEFLRVRQMIATAIQTKELDEKLLQTKLLASVDYADEQASALEQVTTSGRDKGDEQVKYFRMTKKMVTLM